MPVVETDFLKGLLDPKDRFHIHSVKALEKVTAEQWHMASSAFVELDLLLKNSKISVEDRIAVFQTLKSEIPAEMILTLSHEAMVQALLLQEKYPQIDRFYFDSLHLSSAILLDHKIVSSDKTFDEIQEVKRTPLEEL
jgi:predicted nucleic acid-binding protein